MRTFRCIVLLALFLWACSASCHAARHALLVAVWDYEGTGHPSLEGPPNDVRLMQEILVERFGFEEDDIVVLRNAQATRTALEAAFASLAERVRPGDFVYIHYSGHGSTTRDLDGDEPSGFDQTWVSHGSRKHGKDSGNPDDFDVLDDELDRWLRPLYARTDRIVLVSDSCHSATASRGETSRVRAISADVRPHPLGRTRSSDASAATGVRIGAVRDDQKAVERETDEGKVYGVFTWHWARALREASPDETWDDVFKRA